MTDPGMVKWDQAPAPNRLNRASSVVDGEIKMQGYLFKLSTGKFKRWQQRHFTLASHYLNYSTDAGEAQTEEGVTATIDLNATRKVVLRRTRGGGAQFVLHVGSNEFDFKAKNVKEAEEWVDSLQEFAPNTRMARNESLSFAKSKSTKSISKTGGSGKAGALARAAREKGRTVSSETTNPTPPRRKPLPPPERASTMTELDRNAWREEQQKQDTWAQKMVRDKAFAFAFAFAFALLLTLAYLHTRCGGGWRVDESQQQCRYYMVTTGTVAKVTMDTASCIVFCSSQQHERSLPKKRTEQRSALRRLTYTEKLREQSVC
jgi:hypothetical protein